jgi:hypothetical protein
LSTRLLPRQQKKEDRAVSHPTLLFKHRNPVYAPVKRCKLLRTPEQSFAKCILGVRKSGEFRPISGNLLFCRFGGLNMFANTMPRFYERVIPSVPLSVLAFQRYLQIIWLEAEHKHLV